MRQSNKDTYNPSTISCILVAFECRSRCASLSIGR